MFELQKTFSEMYRFRQYSQEKKEQVQGKRFRALLRYAVKHSAFYRDLYKDVDLSKVTSPAMLPGVTKGQMMEHFDGFVTDPVVTLEGVHRFMTDDANRAKRFLGRYYTFHTSGSTWLPATVLYDEMAFWAFENGLYFVNPKPAYPSVVLVSDNGFFIGNVSSRQDKTDKTKNFLLDSHRPIAAIAADLDRIQPGEIHSYAGTLEALAYEQLEGRLQIRPKAIFSTGEYLSDQAKALIENTFHCPVKSVYTSTETGIIGSTCPCGHIHLAQDYLMIEPVDKYGHPVPDGTVSDKLYITNLINRIQPFIRYEVGDQVCLHREPCACGDPSPWVEVFGRVAEVLKIERDGKTVHIPPTEVRKRIVTDDAVLQFQVILHGRSYLEVRLLLKSGADAAAIRERVASNLSMLLADNGIFDMPIRLSDALPGRDEKSSKLRLVFSVDE